MEGSVEAPQTRNTFGIRTDAMVKVLDNISPNAMVPLLLPFTIYVSDLIAILWGFSEEIMLQVTTMLKEKESR